MQSTIDIQALVDEKIIQMNEGKTIQTLIQTGVEKAITSAISDAISGYSFRSRIKDKISGNLESALEEVDYSTYSGFVVDTIKTIVEGVVREDLRERTEKMIMGMFFSDRKEIKLSEIFTAYRDLVIRETDGSDQYERQTFHASMKEQDTYGWLNIELHPEKVNHWSSADIKFTVHKNRDGSGWISTVYLEGVALSEKMKLGRLSDIELVLVQAAYNKTPIVIDVEDESDIDNSYDVDI